MAGFISFITMLYIIFVNSSILKEAGIPQQAAMIATICASALSCLFMGIIGKTPLIVVPGMGINVIFTYTLVHGMGLTWQQALGIVILTGICLAIISFTSLVSALRQAIPDSLQAAICVGIGLMLIFIGLQKGDIIASDHITIITLQSCSIPGILVTTSTFILTCILFLRKVPGSLLIAIIFGTATAYLSGVVIDNKVAIKSMDCWLAYYNLFGQWTFQGIPIMRILSATFCLTLVLLFENVGIITTYLQMCNQEHRFQRSMQATSLSVITCGILGTSPTVTAVETIAGIAIGGRTGWTSITTGILFSATLMLLPVLTFVPDQAVAPILILIGGLIMLHAKKITFDPLYKGLPACFTIACIPLTYSIIDGIACGFISWTLCHLAAGKADEIKPLFYFITGLFMMYFILQIG